MRTGRPGAGGPWVAVAALLLLGCGEAGGEGGRAPPPTGIPRVDYARALSWAGLDATDLGRAWRTAGRRALEEPPTVALPHREEGWFREARPEAASLAFRVPRGRRLEVDVRWASEGSRLFVDLFRERPGEAPERVAHLDPGGGPLEVAAFRETVFVLRLQPELLGEGRYEVALSTGPILSFPVEGRDEGAILSFFGAAREGGRREHHGVDIFAPRGTPVLAAADGVVSRVDTTRLGGRVVWLRESAGRSGLYYAHLETPLVRRGQRVRPGDTVGLVGNSGNARGTRPHLHFGIYRRGEGPLDPLPFLVPPPEVPGTLPGAAFRPGAWVRVEPDDGAGGLGGRGAEFDPLRTGAAPGIGRSVGRAVDGYRVRFPDGRDAVVAAVTVAAERLVSVPEGGWLRGEPSPGAPGLIRIEPGSDVTVLGEHRGWSRVRTPSGEEGWVEGI